MKRSPAIHEAFAARDLANMNALPEAYPHGTPCIVLQAMRQLDHGINAGQAEKMRNITKGGKS